MKTLVGYAFATAILAAGLGGCAAQADDGESASSTDSTQAERAEHERRLQYTTDRANAANGGAAGPGEASPGAVSVQMFNKQECMTVGQVRCCWDMHWYSNDTYGGAHCTGDGL